MSLITGNLRWPSRTLHEYFMCRTDRVMINSHPADRILMKILNISPHPELLVLGTSYLQALSFQVAAARDLPGVVDAFGAGEEFDLVILCHTLADAQKRSICEFVRARCPLARLFELYFTAPPITLGVTVEATTEFHPLMRILALDGTNSEIIRPLRQARSNASMTRSKLA